MSPLAQFTYRGVGIAHELWAYCQLNSSRLIAGSSAYDYRLMATTNFDVL
jgi:hypothetical protein